MPRRLEKLWHAFLLLFGAATLCFFSYNLYCAAVYRTINVYWKLGFGFGVEGWVSYDNHPGAFWVQAVFDLVVVLALSIVPLWAFRFERKRLRKLEMRPPIESVIRQTTSDR